MMRYLFDTSELRPVLLQDEGGKGGEQRPHKAVERPPVVLEDEPGEYDQAAQGVVDEHDLGGAAQDPVQQLQQEEAPWKTQASLELATPPPRPSLRVKAEERLRTFHPFRKGRHVSREVGQEFSEASPGHLRGGGVRARRVFLGLVLLGLLVGWQLRLHYQGLEFL